jgi:hypothetical protein
MVAMKKPYEKPVLSRHGKLGERAADIPISFVGN